MKIVPNTSVELIQAKGSANQAASVTYFDKDGNGIIDKSELDTFNRSKIDKSTNSLTITSADGYADTYENYTTKRDASYYEQGSIPIAVIDTFSGNGNAGSDHGYGVSNIIKTINPDISITQVNASHMTCYNKLQTAIVNTFVKYPELEKAMVKNPVTKLMIDAIFNNKDELTLQAYSNAIQQVQNDIDNGKEYKAVNLSAGYDVSYEAINSIVQEELGMEVTPENLKENKEKIKEILKNHQDETISCGSVKRGEQDVKVSDLIMLIEQLENLEIPVYIAGSYKIDPENDIEGFNLLALADNTLSVEAGVETENGEIIHDSTVSHNSLALDENGKKRIADSICYDGESLDRGSTSFATPMVLARELSEQYGY